MTTRRDFLAKCANAGFGLSAAALTARVAAADRVPRGPDFAPRAKRVIFLTQSGGPSQLELFDPKPELLRWEGKVVPDSIRRGQRVSTMTSKQKQILMAARARFVRSGESGLEIGEWLPHIASIADRICVVRSMHTEPINHAPAMTQLLSGHQLPGRPSVGAWVDYGLGTDNPDLPGFVALVSRMRRPSDQPLYEYYWGAGFLPSRHQGVKLRSGAEPVLYLRNPAGVSRRMRRALLDELVALNRRCFERMADPETLTRSRQYELAYRMQRSVPELVDLSDEPDWVFEEYGPDSRRPGSYAANCILARRLAERGVRFVQLFHPDWDHHRKLTAWCPARCRDTDQASAALIRDLERRGLLDDTLVFWGGEFGRSPVGQGNYKSDEAGRDHHPLAFSIFLAGAGVRRGMAYGATDELGYRAVEQPVHVHDLQATMLHLLGIDHEKLTYRYQGRDFRLTDVHGKVVHDILS